MNFDNRNMYMHDTQQLVIKQIIYNFNVITGPENVPVLIWHIDLNVLYSPNSMTVELRAPNMSRYVGTVELRKIYI